MLTIYAVDSLDDIVASDGFVTLREAIQAADANTAVYMSRWVSLYQALANASSNSAGLSWNRLEISR